MCISIKTQDSGHLLEARWRKWVTMDFKYIDTVFFLNVGVAYTGANLIILYIHILNSLYIYNIIFIKVFTMKEYHK